MKRLVITTISIASFIGAHEAAATPINVTANRFIQFGSDITGDFFGPASPSSALGSFVDSDTVNLGDENVTADQDSNINVAAGSFGGNGASIVGFSPLEDENVSALSFFEVEFDLTTAHTFSLSGELFANVDGGRGLAIFDLMGPSGFSFMALDFDTVSLLSSGTLLPGSYHLTVSSLMDRGDFDPGSFMGGTASYSFALNLQNGDTPGVPEPASLALLVLGLAIAGIRKRT